MKALAIIVLSCIILIGIIALFMVLIIAVFRMKDKEHNIYEREMRKKYENNQ